MSKRYIQWNCIKLLVLDFKKVKNYDLWSVLKFKVVTSFYSWCCPSSFSSIKRAQLIDHCGYGGCSSSINNIHTKRGHNTHECKYSQARTLAWIHTDKSRTHRQARRVIWRSSVRVYSVLNLCVYYHRCKLIYAYVNTAKRGHYQSLPIKV